MGAGCAGMGGLMSCWEDGKGNVALTRLAPLTPPPVVTGEGVPRRHSGASAGRCRAGRLDVRFFFFQGAQVRAGGRPDSGRLAVPLAARVGPGPARGAGGDLSPVIV